MREEHLTEEALLKLAGGRLPADDRRAADEHLAQCAKCRKNLAGFRLVHFVMRRMSEIGYYEALGEAPPNRPGRAQGRKRHDARGFAFPWEPVVGIIVGCICVFALLFSSRSVPTVSAAELLSNAMQHENRVDNARAYRVQVSGQTCTSGQTSQEVISFDNSARCGRALLHIQDTPWGHGNPLSATTYASWHNSVHRRQDRVTKRDKSWEIQTTTDESAIHQATLELRASDYRATKLTLDFADNEEVIISEQPTLLILPVSSRSDITAKNLPPKPELEHVDDPSDVLEVQAWSALHRLDADSGWEAIVLRNISEVRIKAIVRDDARKQELAKVLAAYPRVVVDVRLITDPGDVNDVFPDRLRFSTDAPALADEWTRQQFPDADARAEFRNRTLDSSQEILGRAFILDRLVHRQTALAHCSCKKELAALVATEQRSLIALETGLSTALEPLFSAPNKAPARVLTLAQAQLLDECLHELLWRNPSTSAASLDARVQEVHKLLMGS